MNESNCKFHAGENVTTEVTYEPREKHKCEKAAQKVESILGKLSAFGINV